MAGEVDWQARAARLDDVQAIWNLKARYFRYMDTRDWTAMHDVFATDAVMDMRDEMATLAKSGMPVDPEGGLIVGRERIVASMESALIGTKTVHHGHMPEIEFMSDEEARGIWAMEDTVMQPPSAPFKMLHGYGHYHETYAREDRRWRIKHLRLTRLLVELS
jgi:SnoaL-like protein